VGDGDRVGWKKSQERKKQRRPSKSPFGFFLLRGEESKTPKGSIEEESILE
jgi:hypothetical protein